MTFQKTDWKDGPSNFLQNIYKITSGGLTNHPTWNNPHNVLGHSTITIMHGVQSDGTSPSEGKLLQLWPRGKTTWRFGRSLFSWVPLHVIQCLEHVYIYIYICIRPWSLTWNLRFSTPFWKRRFLLETIIFRFHMNLWECIYYIYFKNLRKLILHCTAKHVFHISWFSSDLVISAFHPSTSTLKGSA